jgi:hypothetical protein
MVVTFSQETLVNDSIPAFGSKYLLPWSNELQEALAGARDY